MLRSDLEENFAALISEIDDVEVQFANSERARKRLAAVRQGIEGLYAQTAAERKHIEQAEAALRDSEDYNKILFQESHRPIVVFDPEAKRFIDANQAAARIFGYSLPNDIIGKTPLDMAAPTQYDGTDSATASQRRDQSALTHEIESFEWRHQRPNGEIWDALVHLLSLIHI